MIGQMPFNPLPAVVIGGPPHSGKSVLTYSLTQALRARDVEHYVLRAYPPDYEGDWFLACDQEQVRHLRLKGAQSEAWLPLVQRDIARRHLPLIVDLGGLPTPEQEALLDVCTHAILLTPDETTHASWRARFERHGLVLLADLRSELEGQTQLIAEEPLLTGTLARLERGSQAAGPTFDALVARLSLLFTRATYGLRRQHLEMAPVELVVDVQSLAHSLGCEERDWLPEDLPRVLDYLPQGEPLGLYGRGPNWLYAAVAVHALPSPFYLFDVRLGWIVCPVLRVGTLPPDAPLQVQITSTAHGAALSFRLVDAYLDVTTAPTLCAPPVSGEVGVILNGKLPHWLWCALARAYRTSWVALFQPQVQSAVVVAARSAAYPAGTCLPFTP
ncbi:MAG TPA: CRISPR-associated protein Csx3 [Anaerolineae bacterium]|nr:CRISPR-associated protein Csx3 [Anaerolineae bacterium]HQK14892.1 CRISPR-associated protein Csx3 [Anaerolineae bacterium]